MRTLLPRPYPITLHHHTGRTVESRVWARSVEHAAERAWRYGSFDNWAAVTIIDDGVPVRVEAPDDVAGWHRQEGAQPNTPASEAQGHP